MFLTCSCCSHLIFNLIFIDIFISIIIVIIIIIIFFLFLFDISLYLSCNVDVNILSITILCQIFIFYFLSIALFGGTRTSNSVDGKSECIGGTHVRPDIHVLIVGDPGLGKVLNFLFYFFIVDSDDSLSCLELLEIDEVLIRIYF